LRFHREKRDSKSPLNIISAAELIIIAAQRPRRCSNSAQAGGEFFKLYQSLISPMPPLKALARRLALCLAHPAIERKQVKHEKSKG
jgi:hypothetical protein